VGDHARVMRDLRVIEQLADRAVVTCSMIEQLVKITIEETVIDLVRSDRLRLAEWDHEKLASLTALLGELDSSEDLSDVTRFEQWGLHGMLDWLYADTENGQLTAVGVERFLMLLSNLEGQMGPDHREDKEVNTFLRRQLAHQVLSVDRLREASDQFYQLLRLDLEESPWQLVSFRSEELSESWTSRGDMDLRYAPISVTVPDYSRFYQRGVSSQATSYSVQLLLHLHLHRSVHGSFPETIEQLDQAGIIDPYSGMPLKYIFVDGQPHIYSLGPDRDDDQGRSLLDDDGKPIRWPEFIPLDDFEAMTDAGRKSIDGDWVLYPIVE
jgi:hypothetical protein